MTQRRLRPSQGGKFHEPIYPSDNGVHKDGWDLIDLWTASDLAHYNNGEGIACYGDLACVDVVNHFPSYAAAARLCTEQLYDEPEDDGPGETYFATFGDIPVGQFFEFAGFEELGRMQKVGANEYGPEGTLLRSYGADCVMVRVRS